MSVEIEIKGHGGRLAIEVLGYENPTATNASDANWLACTVRVGLGGVQAQAKATFTTQDFARFRREVGELLDGKRPVALFDTYERALELRLEGTSTGRIPISGHLRTSEGPAATVSFKIESDQSYLTPVISALDFLLARFPVRS